MTWRVLSPNLYAGPPSYVRELVSYSPASVGFSGRFLRVFLFTLGEQSSTLTALLRRVPSICVNFPKVLLGKDLPINHQASAAHETTHWRCQKANSFCYLDRLREAMHRDFIQFQTHDL